MSASKTEFCGFDSHHGYSLVDEATEPPLDKGGGFCYYTGMVDYNKIYQYDDEQVAAMKVATAALKVPVPYADDHVFIFGPNDSDDTYALGERVGDGTWFVRYGIPATHPMLELALVLASMQRSVIDTDDGPYPEDW